MKNQRHRLNDWLNGFIDITTDVSPAMKNLVEFGKPELVVPGDIIHILKKRGIVSPENFFQYQSQVGDRFLKVVEETRNDLMTTITIRQGE